MRVCHPLPADLNAFTTSGDNLMVVEIFASAFMEPLGRPTRRAKICSGVETRPSPRDV
jgi:hypothetical protein